MAWARIDDGFHDHPKITRIFDRNPGAVGLLVFAISYCAKHETDGFIHAGTVARLSPIQSDRDEQVSVLLEEGALHKHEDGFVVNGYLDYNLSREQIEEKREIDRERKRAARNRKGGSQ